MMRGRHVRRGQRWLRCPRRVPCCVLATAVLAAGLVGFQVGPGVAAAFTSHTTATTGTLSFARLTASFATGTDDLGNAGGTGGSSYTMAISSLAVLSTAHRFTTLTNTGSVTESITGSFTESNVSGSMTVAVDACSVAWAAGLCTGTTTSLLTAKDVSTAPSVTYGSLAVNGVLNLRYTFTATGSLAASATVVATAVPTGTGTGNRTAG